MLDPVQTALFLVIIVLAILLLTLSIQVFFILRELRQTVSKANKVLDNTNLITEKVSGPISTLSSWAMGIKTGASFINFLKGSRKAKRRDREKEEHGKQ